MYNCCYTVNRHLGCCEAKSLWSHHSVPCWCSVALNVSAYVNGWLRNGPKYSFDGSTTEDVVINLAVASWTSFVWCPDLLLCELGATAVFTTILDTLHWWLAVATSGLLWSRSTVEINRDFLDCRSAIASVSTAVVSGLWCCLTVVGIRSTFGDTRAQFGVVLVFRWWATWRGFVRCAVLSCAIMTDKSSKSGPSSESGATEAFATQQQQRRVLVMPEAFSWRWRRRLDFVAVLFPALGVHQLLDWCPATGLSLGPPSWFRTINSAVSAGCDSEWRLPVVGRCSDREIRPSWTDRTVQVRVSNSTTWPNRNAPGPFEFDLETRTTSLPGRSCPTPGSARPRPLHRGAPRPRHAHPHPRGDPEDPPRGSESGHPPWSDLRRRRQNIRHKGPRCCSRLRSSGRWGRNDSLATAEYRCPGVRGQPGQKSDWPASYAGSPTAAAAEVPPGDLLGLW